jgi:hypothetical protein
LSNALFGANTVKGPSFKVSTNPAALTAGVEKSAFPAATPDVWVLQQLLCLRQQ